MWRAADRRKTNARSAAVSNIIPDATRHPLITAAPGALARTVAIAYLVLKYFQWLHEASVQARPP